MSVSYRESKLNKLHNITKLSFNVNFNFKCKSVKETMFNRFPLLV